MFFFYFYSSEPECGTDHVPNYLEAMDTNNVLDVLPPLVQSGRFDEFIDAGRTLSMSLSPLDNSVATYVTVEVEIVYIRTLS